MRHDRLKLVVPENSAVDGAIAETNGSPELRAVPATPGSSVRPLRVVDTDEGLHPDDAA